MIIDIHTHTFPPKIAAAALADMQAKSRTALFADGTADDLSAHLREAGADLAVVQPVATSPRQVAHINDSVIRTNAAASQTGVLSFGAMHPAFEDWERELDRLAEAGVRGIKLHPCYQQTPMDDPRCIEILRRCAVLGLIVLVHAGWDVGLPGSDDALPVRIRRALDAAGPVTLIAAHMGGWRDWEEGIRLLPETGAYIDTAFSLGSMTPAFDGAYPDAQSLMMLTPNAAMAVIRAFGPERVLFGTDSPWGSLRAEIKKIRALPLSAEEQAAILGGNAARLLEVG